MNQKQMELIGGVRALGVFVAVAFTCLICGCGEKNAPPPVAATDKAPNAVAAGAVQDSRKTPVQSVEVIDIADFISHIPTNEFAISPEGGWDKFTMPKVQKWFREKLHGNRGRINLGMAQGNVSQEDANSKPDEWTVSIDVSGTHANYATMANRILTVSKSDSRMPYPDKDNPSMPAPSIGIKEKANFSFKCNEAEARKWDAFSKTTMPAVTVEGDVLDVAFVPHLDASLGDFLGYDVFVQLDKVKLVQSKDIAPGALFACEYQLLMMAQDGLSDVPDEAITEFKYLENSNKHHLIFVKYNDWHTGKRNRSALLSFGESDTKISFTSCGVPPTGSDIAAAKAKVGWPKSGP